jgi:hypothetical protein
LYRPGPISGHALAAASSASCCWRFAGPELTVPCSD